MIPLPRRKTFIDFFPVPEFLLISTTGIVITDDDTKFVELKKATFGDGFTLSHATKIPNPIGAVESGLILNPNSLTPVLKKTAEHYGIHYAQAVLPEEKSYLFTTTIDWVPREGLRDAVAFIIEENAPVSLVDSVFDFEVIEENRSGGKIRLAVSVLPKNIVKAYVDLLESAGITPTSFRLESQAIARAVVHHSDKRAHLIINLSPKKTGFYVVENGVVQFSTTPNYGVNTKDPYLNLIDLKAEMRKVLLFWNVKTDKPDGPDGKIGKAVLCGPSANNKSFVDKFMEESGVEYTLADVWLNTSSSRKQVPEIPFAESLDYAPAIGLVLSQSK